MATTTANTTTTIATVPATSSAPSTTAPAFSTVAGKYVGKSSSSGNAEIRLDGTGQFEDVDLTACPSCNNASAPHATIDFKLTTLAPDGGAGGYQAAGTITAESDPADASTFASKVGSSMKATFIATGDLVLSFLPADDILKKTSAPAGGTASGNVQVLTIPDTERAALRTTHVEHEFRAAYRDQIDGPLPGSVYYALDTSTNTYWAIATVLG